MINFKKYGGKKRIVNVADPLKLFDSLDVKTSHTTLRPAQIEALQELTVRRSERDHVLKVNTGAGKTTVALLYLWSHAAEKKRPAVYLCSTTQLMAQISDEATRLGILAVSYPATEPHPEPKGMNGEAIIVCTYEKLFNARTTFDRTDVMLSPCAIVLDDAHAGVDRIRDAFTIRLSRLSQDELYEKILRLLKPGLKAYMPGAWAEIVRKGSEMVQEVPYWVWRPLVEEIRNLLAAHAEDSELRFVWGHLRDQLEWCRCIVANSGLEILPDILPVEKVRAYKDAPHRLFTSATLADDSVLVRELCCAVKAASNPIQPAADQGVGERMVLAPTLVDKRLDRRWVMDLCADLSMRVSVVVLAATKRAAEDWEVVGATSVVGEEVENAVQGLRKGKLKFVVFANRYDGVDLPDDACRVLVLDGMPYGESLTSRYDSDMRCRPETAHNRLVHRIEQGMGRAVRSHADYAVVVLAGPELASFVSRMEIQEQFNPATRAQIQYVHDLAEIALDEHPKQPHTAVTELLWACLNRSEDWKDLYEEKVRGVVQSNSRSSTDNINMANAEREAALLATRREPSRAAETVESALTQHVKDESQKALYLQVIAKYRFAVDEGHALQIQAAAHQRNDRMFMPPIGTVRRPDKSVGHSAPTSILRWYAEFHNVNGVLAELQSVRTRLSFDTNADTFEQALMDLASLLGAEGSRPEKKFGAGPDNLWLWSDEAAVIEAKNEASYERLPKSDSGQLHNSVEWFNKIYPGRPVTPIIVAQATQAARDAEFPRGTRVLTSKNIDKMLNAVEAFLGELVKKPAMQWTGTQIFELLNRHKLTSKQLISTYTAQLR